MNKELSVNKLWNNIYKQRQSKHYPRPTLNRIDFEMEKIFRQFLPIKRDLNFIEIGCGDSYWLPYFCKEFGYNIHGIDYSAEGIKKAIKNLRINGLYNYEANLHCLDFLNLKDNFSNGFDILMSLGVIEHFEEPKQIIKIFTNLLKEDGIMITWIPNKSGLIMKMQKTLNRNFYDTHKAITLDQLIRYHEINRLKIISSSYNRMLDLSILNFSNFTPNAARFIEKLITMFNLPILAASKYLNCKIESAKLSSAMYVIARKQ